MSRHGTPITRVSHTADMQATQASVRAPGVDDLGEVIQVIGT